MTLSRRLPGVGARQPRERSKSRVTMALLVALSLVVGGASIGLGATAIPPARAFEIMRSAFLHGRSTMLSPETVIVLDIRLPRTLLGFFVGGALAMSGALLQAASPLGRGSQRPRRLFPATASLRRFSPAMRSACFRLRRFSAPSPRRRSFTRSQLEWAAHRSQHCFWPASNSALSPARSRDLWFILATTANCATSPFGRSAVLAGRRERRPRSPLP